MRCWRRASRHRHEGRRKNATVESLVNDRRFLPPAAYAERVHEDMRAAARRATPTAWYEQRLAVFVLQRWRLQAIWQNT